MYMNIMYYRYVLSTRNVFSTCPSLPYQRPAYGAYAMYMYPPTQNALKMQSEDRAKCSLL